MHPNIKDELYEKLEEDYRIIYRGDIVIRAMPGAVEFSTPEGEFDEVRVDPHRIDQASSGLYNEVIDAGVTPEEAYENFGQSTPWLAVVDKKKHATSILPRERRPVLETIGDVLESSPENLYLDKFGNFLGR